MTLMPDAVRTRSALAAEVAGPLYVPGDPELADEVSGYNLAVQHDPVVVVGAIVVVVVSSKIAAPTSKSRPATSAAAAVTVALSVLRCESSDALTRSIASNTPGRSFRASLSAACARG